MAVLQNVDKRVAVKNEVIIYTVNTDLADVSSQQMPTQREAVQTSVPQINLKLSDHLDAQHQQQQQRQENPHLKSPKQSKRKTSKQSAHRLAYSPNAQK